eukprot:GHRQ01014893.1.p2 GENE.GHRQ01014893.1~~GHRQ01014893.1.p2  ORF type:complete len:143 (-),score=13.82 GHRQ01014893.1:711-1139(-)
MTLPKLARTLPKLGLKLQICACSRQRILNSALHHYRNTQSATRSPSCPTVVSIKQLPAHLCEALALRPAVEHVHEAGSEAAKVLLLVNLQPGLTRQRRNAARSILQDTSGDNQHVFGRWGGIVARACSSLQDAAATQIRDEG